MRLTHVLYRRNLSFKWRNLLASKRVQYKDFPVRVPKALVEKGVEIVDPIQKPPFDRWQPPVPDPRFYKHPKRNELINFNEETAYLYHPNCRIFRGSEQASILAKAQIIEGLPKNVEQLLGVVNVPDQNLLLQRYIMLGQYWNTTSEKLPKRIDIRKPGWKFQAQYGIPNKLQGCILLDNLLRLCQSQVTQLPSLEKRRLINQPYLNSHFYYRGKPVIIRGLSEWLVTSDKPITPFADENIVDASVNYTLPNMYPIVPTIDLVKENNYTLEHNLGLKSGWNHGHIHTLFTVHSNYWKADQHQARNILLCLGYAVGQARRQFGEITTLPEPICVQCVSLDQQSFSFLFFQLNTLSFDSDHGVKNLIWMDTENKLFNKILSQPWLSKAKRDERLEDFNPKVFEKLLAVYLNGITESELAMGSHSQASWTTEQAASL